MSGRSGQPPPRWLRRLPEEGASRSGRTRTRPSTSLPLQARLSYKAKVKILTIRSTVTLASDSHSDPNGFGRGRDDEIFRTFTSVADPKLFVSDPAPDPACGKFLDPDSNPDLDPDLDPARTLLTLLPQFLRTFSPKAVLAHVQIFRLS